MPDRYCFQIDRTSELQKILSSGNGYRNGDIKKERSSPLGATKLELIASSPLHGRGHVHRNFRSSPKKPRGKESSSHYGVRFRPDLHKWVAEIRVAEWKSVDKKVWLGTFDTEVGAARAVDAARKLLQCKKKRPANFPCLNLDAYSEQIPSHLNLNHLGNEAMFKEATLFVKQKAQEYAASFGTNRDTNICGSVQIPDQVPVIVDRNLGEPDFSTSLSSLSDSHWSSNSEEDDKLLQWEELYDGSVGQINCSFDTLDKSYNYVDLIRLDEQSIVGCVDYENAKLWEDHEQKFGDDEVLLDNMLVGSEFDLILSDNQEYCGHEQTSMDFVTSEDEMPSPNSSCSLMSDISFQKPSSSTADANTEWLLMPQLHSFNYNSSLMSSLDCPQDCY